MPYTRTDILELIAKAEGSGLEFKRDDITPLELAEELVAFSNAQGGIVILGVENDGSISGILRPPDAVEEWAMNVARDLVRPPIIPYFEIVPSVRDEYDVAVIRVEAGWTVHHVWRHNHRYYYIRVGSQTREAGPEELERLMQQRGTFRLELRPVSGTSVNDLDRRRLRDYFTRIREQEAPPEDDEAGWIKLLENVELLAGEGDPRPVSVAGLLLFGRNPRRFLPQSGIDAVAYPGIEKDYGARERAELAGPMVPLFDATGEVVENGLVEQAVDFVRRNTPVTGGLEEGVRRVERPAYPEEAVREAIVNALIHRDYLLAATDIELSIYDNRLEVVSPGRLPNTVTPERMRAGVRAARNQLLKDVMRDYRYLEHMGMGIPRKIVRAMQEHNGTDPDLIEEGETFTIRLWRGEAAG